MISRRSTFSQPPVAPPTRLAPSDVRHGISASEIDWDRWSRHIESRRRKLAGEDTSSSPFSSRDYLAEATYVSFRLEGLDITESEVYAALATGRQRRPHRSRQAQRIRNHVALLRDVDDHISNATPLVPESVVRWYVSLSCGLCPSDLGDSAMKRLSETLDGINSPELRLAPAIQRIAHLHVGFLADPLVPSFNGILARLLLRYQLGRCALPPIFFHPDTPPQALGNERILLPMLMETLETSFNVLLEKR